MIGDSITAGGNWSSRFPGVRIANRGVVSDTSLKILARMDGILATEPDRAFLMFGINDIYNGVPVERIVSRYARIVDILQARGVEVVIQSTLACAGSVCGDKLVRVGELNRRLKALARQKRVKFIDINSSLSDRSGLRASYTRDGVHITQAGYRVWYAALAPHMQ